MTIKIKHGIPKHPYFIIAQPKRSYEESRTSENKPIIELTDPITNDLIKAELQDYWTVPADDFESMRALALMAYGYHPADLKQKLLEKYPELRQNFIIEYWLLKRI